MVFVGLNLVELLDGEAHGRGTCMGGSSPGSLTATDRQRRWLGPRSDIVVGRAGGGLCAAASASPNQVPAGSAPFRRRRSASTHVEQGVFYRHHGLVSYGRDLDSGITTSSYFLFYCLFPLYTQNEIHASCLPRCLINTDLESRFPPLSFFLLDIFFYMFRARSMEGVFVY